MSSKNIKITNQTIGVAPFRDFQGISNGLRSVQKSLQSISNTVNTFMKIANPFFQFFSQNPLTTVYRAILKQVENTINTYISSGAGIIVITPFNQKNKRTLDIKVDLLNPVSEFNQTVAAFQKIDNNYKVKDEIKRKEQFILTLQTDKLPGYETIVQQIKTEISELQKQITEVKYEDQYLNKIDFKIPKLSPSDAIAELIQSFYNAQDVNRPKWNSANNVAGLGFIFSATTQIELINNLNKLNQLFRLTTLAKSYDKFNKDIREWASTIETKAQKKEQKLLEDKLIVALNSINKENKSEDDKKAMLKALKDYIDTVYTDPIVASVTDSDFPKWIPFTIEVIPYIREIRDTFLKVMDMLTIGTEATDSILKTLVTTFIKKVNAFVKLLYDINTALNFIQTLQFGLNATVFKINEDFKDRGGGVDYLVKSLRTLQNFPSNLFDTKLSTSKKVLDEIARLKQSEFSCLVFLAVGSPNFNIIMKQFETLQKLFNIKSGSSIVEDKKQISQTNPFDKPDFIINPEFLDIKQLVTKKDISFDLFFNPLCVSFSYELNCMSNLNFKSIIKLSTIIGSQSKRTIIFTKLLDNEQYELIINFKGKYLQQYSKKYYFSTNFSLDGTDISSDEGIITDPLVTENGVSITNNSNNTITIRLVDQNGQVIIETFILPNTVGTIPIIGSDGLYEVQILLENGNYISRIINKYSEFLKLSLIDIEKGIIYIKKDPTVLYISRDIGEIINISNSINSELKRNPSFILLSPGIYFFSIYNNGKWVTKQIRVVLSTNVSDFCLTIPQ